MTIKISRKNKRLPSFDASTLNGEGSHGAAPFEQLQPETPKMGAISFTIEHTGALGHHSGGRCCIVDVKELMSWQ
jgi:hypothetical protein